MIRRFTWVELLVVIFIIAVSLVILIPLVNSYRESARRTTCEDNSHQIGLAFRKYAATFNHSYPPSASVAKAADGTLTVGGYSFLVRLVPFMDRDALYKTLPTDGDPEDASNPAIVAATNARISSFLCPSSPHKSTRPQSAGVTNYKAMGASTRGSLIMVVNPRATPPYGTMAPINGTLPLHPDGAIFPAASNLPDSAILDGESHTIFIIETIDDLASRWTVGKEATLVGMPQSSSPTGTTPQVPHSFFVQPGYDHTWGEKSGVTKAGMRTFLSYDFSPTGADAGKYEDPGFGQIPPAYGPSSMHPGVVVCGFGDASTQALSREFDAANLLFLITKSNSDPFCDPAP